MPLDAPKNSYWLIRHAPNSKSKSECCTKLWSNAAVVLGLLLIFWPSEGSVQGPFIPQEEPIVRSRGAHHIFSTGEPVSLVDFLAAEVRRSRRGDMRLANQAVISLTEVELRRRKAKSRQMGKAPSRSGESTTGTPTPESVSSLEPGYWAEGNGHTSLTVERHLLQSTVLERIKVAKSRKSVFCPISGAGGERLLDLLRRTKDGASEPLISLSDYSLRDRERFLTRRDVFRFVFVRHPFYRAADAYLRGVTSGDLASVQYREFMGLVRGRPLNEHEQELQKVSTLFFLTFLNRQPTSTLSSHFQPQVDLCGIGLVDYNAIGRMENFKKDLATIANKLALDDKENLPAIEEVLNLPELHGANVTATAMQLFASSKHRAKASKLYASDLATLAYSPTQPPPGEL